MRNTTTTTAAALLASFFFLACSDGDGRRGQKGSTGDSALGGASGETTNTPGTTTPLPPASGDGSFDEIPSGVAQCSAPGVSDPDVLAALSRGEGSQVPEATQLIAATRGALDVARKQMDGALIKLFDLKADGTPDENSLTAITWDPGRDGAMLGATPGHNAAVLLSNATGVAGGSVLNDALAVAGESKTTRYLALASNPFSGGPNLRNEQMIQFSKNALAWLTGKSADESQNIVVAQLTQDYFFPDNSSTRAFLKDALGDAVTVNDSNACDGAALSDCLAADPDLLIISSWFDSEKHDTDAIATAVKSAMERGVPVLYMHFYRSQTALSRSLLDAMHVEYVRDNYWSQQKIVDGDGSARVGALSPELESIDETLRHLADDDFSFSLADVAANPSQNADYKKEFGAGTTAVRSRLRNHDTKRRAIFDDCIYGVDKLLVLLADRLRQDVQYPLSAATSNRADFLRAYFADYAVYNLRSVGAALPNRGNFDPKDLSSVVGTSKTVKLMSRKSFRSAGVYLLPGQPARITRKDSAAVNTKIFVNSIRDGATQEWKDGGYTRPKHLQSVHLSLAPGGSIIVNNPYGGPLQVEFDTNDVEVQLEFDNIGLHPHWRSSADDETFAARLAEGTYNWVEVATSGFELHSRAELFAKTMKNERWNTAAKLAATIAKYSFDEVHVMAGFQGEGISYREDVHGWAQAAGLTVPTLESVKHANMDQASCGSGCSGNPYDANWAFNPIGHGDLHELGHSLQNGRFQLTHAGSRYENHAVTNWTPFHSASRYYEDNGGSTSVWTIPHAHLFTELQAAHVAGERSGDFSTHMDQYLGSKIANASEIRNAYAFIMQAGMSARHAGAIDNGYYLVPRVHIIDRALKNALTNEESWLAARSSIGFSEYSLAEAKALDNNDFMLVALSFAMGLDYTDFFDMWGVATTATARAQVASFASPVVPRAFFAMSNSDHAYAALSTEFERITRLPVDGTTAWPTP